MITRGRERGRGEKKRRARDFELEKKERKKIQLRSVIFKNFEIRFFIPRLRGK